MIELRHAAGEILHFLFHVAQIREDRHGLGKHSLSGQREAVLRQVAGADALGGAEGAVVEGFKPGQDFHHGGFASTVCSNQADTVAGRNHPVRSFKQELVAISFSGC